MSSLSILLTFLLAYHPVNSDVATVYRSSAAIAANASDTELQPICGATIIYHKKGEPILAITAEHCTAKPMTLAGHENDKDFQYTVRPIVKIKEPDLALVVSNKLAKENGTTATFATEEPKIGDSLWSMGSPNGVYKRLSHGILSNVAVDEGIKYYVSDFPGFPGSSGGAIFNSKQQIVGIVVRIPQRNKQWVPGQVICISLPVIRWFMSSGFKAYIEKAQAKSKALPLIR